MYGKNRTNSYEICAMLYLKNRPQPAIFGSINKNILINKQDDMGWVKEESGKGGG